MIKFMDCYSFLYAILFVLCFSFTNSSSLTVHKSYKTLLVRVLQKRSTTRSIAPSDLNSEALNDIAFLNNSSMVAIISPGNSTLERNILLKRKSRHHSKSRHPLLFDWTSSSCGNCQPERCEAIPVNCPSGLVRDACDCCYVCGNLEDTPCDLPSQLFRFGQCGKGLVCAAYEENNGETVGFCTCSSTNTICGSDGRTYSNPCRFKRASGRIPGLAQAHEGPCLAEPLMEIPLMNQTAEEGASAVFSCSVSGYPFAWFEWLKDGHSIFQPGLSKDIVIQIRNGPLKYQVTSWLEIEKVQYFHTGSYACVAKNQYGDANATARLEVVDGDGDHETSNHYIYRGKKYSISDTLDGDLEENKRRKNEYASSYLESHVLPEYDEPLAQSQPGSNLDVISSQSDIDDYLAIESKDELRHDEVIVNNLLAQSLRKLMKPKEFKDIFFDDDDFVEGSGSV